MAFASSRLGAQEAIIKPCDLCEDEEDVNWFCKDCVQNLCERCKKTHLKIAICKNHRLVSILEGVVITKKNVSNLCQEHDEPFTFLCRTCEKNICSMCLSVVHKKHDFTNLRNLQSELQGRLDYIIKEKEEEKRQIINNRSELEQCASRCRERLSNGYTAIDDSLKSLHIMVDAEGKRLKNSLKNSTDGQLTELEVQKHKLEKKENEYDETIQTVKQELGVQTTSTINQFVKTSTSKLKSLMPLSYSSPSSYTLSLGNIDSLLIQGMINNNNISLDRRESPDHVNEGTVPTVLPNLEIIRIYKLNVKTFFKTICIIPDGGIWIGGSGYVFKMSSDYSKVIHEIPARELHWHCNYMACLHSGDALVSYGGGSSHIDRFTTDGKRVGFIDLAPADARSIDVTKDGQVAVAIGDGIKAPNPYLVLVSTEGKFQREVNMCKNMGTFCINKDGNYIASNRKSPNLITLDGSGTIIKKIGVKKSDLFRIACDKHGNILAAPRGDSVKEIMFISEKGNVQRTFTVECNDICDICIDSDNHLLILINSGEVIVSRYLK